MPAPRTVTGPSRSLSDAGADINARGLEFHETPLAAAVRFVPWCKEKDRSKLPERRLRMVEFLLKRGAATNLPGDEPWATPLAWARKLRTCRYRGGSPEARGDMMIRGPGCTTHCSANQGLRPACRQE